MFNQFSPTTNQQPKAPLIPSGAMSFGIVEVTGVKYSKGTGGEYANIKVTLVDSPWERRTVLAMICNPSDNNNSEGWRKQGLAALQHCFEAAGVFNPAQPDTYARFANASFADILRELDGKRIAIKVSIEKGGEGYDDKNGVREYLSPNPVSGTHKSWQKLVAGDFGVKQEGAAAPAQASMGFTAPAPAAAAPQPGFTGAAVPGFLAGAQTKPPF